MADSISHYRSEFERRFPDADAQRAAAFQRFAETGFPTIRDEDWKYTDLRKLSQQTPAVDPQSADAGVPQTGIDGIHICLVNGQLTTPGDLPEGLTALPCDAAQADPGGSPLRALNAAFASSGIALTVAASVTLEQPIHLHIHHSDDSGAMRNLRNFIRLERGARAEIIEHYSAEDGAAHFLNAVTQIHLAGDASLQRVLLQNDAAAAWHIHATEVQQLGNSSFRNVGIDLGSRLARNDTQVSLEESGAEVHLNGLYFPDGRRHIDNHTVIEHRAPACVSRETYHGLLNDYGRGVFNGRIVVHKDAQKTDSEQSSRAILLSRHAEVDAKPELEIYADDVKCAHGATVGQLDEEALFYLKSRGIEQDTARALLVFSFADDVLQEIQNPQLRRHVESLVMQRLPGGLAADEVLA